MVHQPAGGRHNDLGLSFQLLDLGADAGAAVKHRHTNALVVSKQTPKLVADLNSQLTGGRQNKALNAFILGVHMLDHRNAEGKGLTRAGRRFCDHILPLQKGRNCQLLNGGRIAVTLFLQGLQHGFAQPQVLKRQYFFFHKYFLFL